MSRLVTLALVGHQGELLGVLPPYAVETPWWSEVASVVAGARTHFNADVTVLRLLDVADVPAQPGLGGRTLYIAELNGPAPKALEQDDRALVEDPRRVPWARPGGPSADLGWAEEALEAAGRSRTGPAVQLRTWNLSSIWRLHTTSGDVWLKVVPPLLAHEGAVLDALASQGAPVPHLIAFDGRGRILLDDVPGRNQWAPDQDCLKAMINILVSLQVKCAGRSGALLNLGVPDWRREGFIAAVAETVASWSAQLPTATRAGLQRLLEGLDDRWAAIETCGLPDTLFHGDFHSGNFRADGTSLVLLDWGDCGFGHPLLDTSGFLDQIDPGRRGVIERAWLSAWSTVIPGCDPDRALDLIGPVAALRRAAVYHRFVGTFERSERPYHEADVPHWLLAAAALA